MTFLPQIEHPWRIESKYKRPVPRVWVEMFNNQELRRRENVMKPGHTTTKFPPKVETIQPKSTSGG